MNRRQALLAIPLVPSLTCGTGGRAGAAGAGIPETVHFSSLDAGIHLVGYLFKPVSRPVGRAPAMVLLHGRAGPYSSLAKGRYDATTLSKRHMYWGDFWARRGAVTLLVDSFGPRGFPAGFAAGTYDDRPSEINEVTVRPLDAYGARAFLSQRPDVDVNKIGLQGWSNGGSATLATMAVETLRSVGLHEERGFRAALAFYPGCGLQGAYSQGYVPYAPVRILIGTADEEVSPQKCKALVTDSRKAGHDIDMTFYPDATHDFDDPGRKRQNVSANAAAYENATALAARFMGENPGI